MDRTIKIRAEYITFSVFAIFLFSIGILNNSSITGFSVKGTEDSLWTIEFDTKERADLTIEMHKGTGYSSKDEVEFISMQCGKDKAIPNILDNKIIYEDYSCENTTKLSFFVNTKGKYKQIIRYGTESKIFSFTK